MNSSELQEIESERYPGEFDEMTRWQATKEAMVSFVPGVPTLQLFREHKARVSAAFREVNSMLDRWKCPDFTSKQGSRGGIDARGDAALRLPRPALHGWPQEPK